MSAPRDDTELLVKAVALAIQNVVDGGAGTQLTACFCTDGDPATGRFVEIIVRPKRIDGPPTAGNGDPG